MNCDLNILWIEDSTSWLETTKEWFLSKTEEENGLLINFRTISNSNEINNLPNSIKQETSGFKLYDIIFVDFNISEETNGAKLIEEFRNSNIDADILFYSDKVKQEKLKETMKNYEFSGIYVSLRDNFQDNAMKLYEKNIRRLTSPLNIRGLLADKTSENDYVINSYLLEKYEKLPSDERKIISEEINSLLENKISETHGELNKANKLLNKNPQVIKKILDLPDFLFSITCKYQIFDKLLQLSNDTTFAEHSISNYTKKIIKMRNTVAHKKIDICKSQKYLKYYDTLKQFRDRACPDDCSGHANEHKISLDDWLNTLKLANEYSKLFNKILEELETETDSPEQ